MRAALVEGVGLHVDMLLGDTRPVARIPVWVWEIGLFREGEAAHL